MFVFVVVGRRWREGCRGREKGEGQRTFVAEVKKKKSPTNHKQRDETNYRVSDENK